MFPFTEPSYTLGEDPRTVSVCAIPPLPRPGSCTHHLPPPPRQPPETDLSPPPPPHRDGRLLYRPGQAVQKTTGAY